MKRIFLLAMIVCVASAAQAQPTRRRATTSTAAAQARPGGTARSTDRASLMFPTSVPMPEDVVWRRDIYRQLDLTLDRNAPLYYPVQPVGTQVNLFTYLFRLLLTGRVPAYNYKLDGNESFAPKDRIGSVKELLDRYYIYYEERDGRLEVADNDVPSAQVTRYYVKESVFMDQRTGTYKTRVVALCPILIEDDGLGSAASKPLFWMNYEDLAPYLSRLPVMASNLNNVTNMTADDFFTLNRYEGKIYKTNNMQGRVLADYCRTDTALVKEQKKIETELTDFERHIWKVEQPKDSADTTAVPQPAKKVRPTTHRTTGESSVEAGATTARTSSTRRSSAAATRQKSSSRAPKASSAPRVSARRTRR